MYDLANYSGQTGVSEAPLNQTVSVESRVKMLEEIFK